MAKFKRSRKSKSSGPNRREILKGTPYDSIFEKDIHERLLQDARFHSKSDKVGYSIPHQYEPDFVLEKEGRVYYIETKGRFRDSSEARKYLFVRENLPENSELIFIWEKADTIFPFAKLRKNGTKATQIEWAEKNGFRNWVQTEFNVEKL